MKDGELISKLGLYRSFAGRADEGYQRIGSFAVDPSSGEAILTVDDESQRVELENLSRGVATRSFKQGITPQTGSKFLAALTEHFDNSSYWRVADETEK